MRNTKCLLYCVLAFCLALVVQPAQSQVIDVVYTVTPNSGNPAAFEAAFKAHIEWRKANGDTWFWEVYDVATGEFGKYYIRSGDHSWADMDAYESGDFNAAANAHWMSTVQPTVESLSSSISVMNEDIVRLPDDPSALRLFQVTEFHLKSGHEEEFLSGIQKFHEVIVEEDIPFYYVMSRLVTGGIGPTMTFVGLSNNWAGFAAADGDAAMGAAMAEKYGAEEAAEVLKQVLSAVSWSESQIFRLRLDLSMLDGM